MNHTLDFIVIGAQKAGTTSLFEYLRRHPELAFPPQKEAAYFSHDSEIAKPWDDYLRRNFSDSDAGLKWGTVSPSYMVGGVYSPEQRSGTAPDYDERTVPRRIRQRLPDVKLIAILRDPVARAQSHHRMMTMTGAERRSFDEAIAELLEEGALRRSRAMPSETTGYVTWGEYGRILTGYSDVFPRCQMFIASSNELEHEAEQLLARMHKFLGVSDLMPDNVGVRYREGGSARRFQRANPDGAVEGVARNRVARSLWHMLPDSSRDGLSRGYAAAAYRIDLWNRRSAEKGDTPSEATVKRLQEHFARDTDHVAMLLGKSPPWHPAAPSGSV